MTEPLPPNIERTPAVLPCKFKIGQVVTAYGGDVEIIAVVFRPRLVYYDVKTPSGVTFHDTPSHDLSEKP